MEAEVEELVREEPLALAVSARGSVYEAPAWAATGLLVVKLPCWRAYILPTARRAACLDTAISCISHEPLSTRRVEIVS
jgi:hypothetical protein